jgi:hypothetical protein
MAKVAQAKTDVAGLSSALGAYNAEYGTLPTGTAAEVMNAFRGENPRKIPWGTPYVLDLSKPEAPRVWSCGPNRRDEGGAQGSDNIVSWR